MATAPHALFIGRLHNQYLVPPEIETPEALRNLYEDAIATGLGTALAKTLGGVLPANDSSIWFARRLAVDFHLNVEVDPGSMAAVWADAISHEVLKLLSTGPSSGDVLQFPDRPTYLAHFLLDLAGGGAWERWYYAPFEGLRALPISAALRSAILDDASVGEQALTRMTADQCVQVGRAMSTADLSRILPALAAIPSSAGVAECIETLAAIHNEVAHSACLEELHALLLFLAVRRKTSSIGGAALLDGSRALARLTACLNRGSGTHIVEALRRMDRALLFRAVGFEDAQVLAPLFQCGADTLDSLLPGNHARTAPRFTSFGGIFLLLPLLDELPIEEATAGWPSPTGVSTAALLRFLILIKCLGARHAAGCSRDPLVRDWSRIPPDIDAAAIAWWTARLRPQHLERFLDTLFRWRLETGSATGDPATHLLARMRGAPVVIRADPGRGIWIGLSREAVPEGEVLPLATGDLLYLGLGKELGVRRAVNLALSVAAQGVLRSFAWKLPGFAQSRPASLESNFLDCSAAVQEDGERYVVRLSRPPLHLVLGLAGLNSSSYRLHSIERSYTVVAEGSSV